MANAPHWIYEPNARPDRRSKFAKDPNAKLRRSSLRSRKGPDPPRSDSAPISKGPDPPRSDFLPFLAPLFGRGGGHHSPIGGYLPDPDLVLVLDVNGSYKPWLVKSERLFEAMNTVDSSTGRKRGLIRIE